MTDLFKFLTRIATETEKVAGLLGDVFIGFYYALDAALQFIWRTLVDVARGVYNVFKKTFGIFHDLWKNHLHPFFTSVVNIFEGMFSAIQQLAAAIQKIVKRIKDFYDTWIGPALTDFLDFISRLRAALVVFRILGFNWAKKLDADLAGIQASVTKIIQDVVGTLNQVTSILQVMVDPRLIIREDFWKHTLFGGLKFLRRANAWGSDRQSTPAEQQRIDDYHNAVFGPNGPARLQPDGSLLVAPAMSEVSAKINARRGALGLTGL